MPIYYISFASDEKGFLGAVVTEASDPEIALIKCSDMGINPGACSQCGKYPCECDDC